MWKWLALAGLFAISPAFSPACSPAWGQARLLPDGPAKHVVEAACVSCHALTQVTGAGHSPEEWDFVVHRMINAGAQVPPDQIPVVIDYLAKNFPPKTLPP